MKYGVLAILVAIMFFATTGMAEESETPRLDPYDTAFVLLKGTGTQPTFIRPSFKPFKAEAKYLKFLEYFSNVEYGFKQEAYLPQWGRFPQKAGLVTRIRLFDKQIYLTFSISR